MTAEALRTLWDSLPSNVRARISRLSKRTGESAESIIERGVSLYERSIGTGRGGKGVGDRLAQIQADPAKAPLYAEIMSAMQERSAKSVTPAKKKARAKAGGAGRAASLTPAERKTIAQNAARARWDKPKKNK